MGVRNDTCEARTKYCPISLIFMNEQLIEYIRKALAEGHSEEDVRKVLLAHGYKEEDIRSALLSIRGTSSHTNASASTSPTNLIGPVELLRRTWNFYLDRIGPILGIIFTPLIFVVPGFLFIFLGLFLDGWFIIFPFVIGAALFVCGFMLYIYSNLAILNFLENSGLRVKEAYTAVRGKLLGSIWIGLLAGLIALAGFVLGVVPALIFGVWFSFALYVFMFQGDKGMAALLKSREYVRGYWWPIFGRAMFVGIITFAVVFLIQLIFSVIPNETIAGISGFVVQIVAQPFTMVYTYLVYKNLVEIKPELSGVVITTRRKFFVWLTIFGLVALPLLFWLVITLAPAGS